MTLDLQNLRVFLADIVPKSADAHEIKERMDELENLISTFGGLVIIKKFQKKDLPDYKTYIGSGKFEELKEEMKLTNSNLLIIGNVLKPSQLYQINERLRDIDAEARDRVDLILKIFERHATTAEAKLQISLAAIKHMGPRIFRMGEDLSRQAGGIGTRGIGETNTERMKRHLRERTLDIEKKLKKFEKNRALHRAARQKRGLSTVGLVGYTNAGKTSILSAISDKKIPGENKLFATLSTQTGKLFFYEKNTGIPREILISDTIGFIRDLPPKLIKAFSSTLEDSIESDFLLHVIDASDPHLTNKIAVVDEILASIKATQPRLLIFNKIDLLTPAARADLESRLPQIFTKLQKLSQKNSQKSLPENSPEKSETPLVPEIFRVSAETSEGIDALRHRLAAAFDLQHR